MIPICLAKSLQRLRLLARDPDFEQHPWHKQGVHKISALQCSEPVSGDAEDALRFMTKQRAELTKAWVWGFRVLGFRVSGSGFRVSGLGVQYHRLPYMPAIRKFAHLGLCS